MPAVDAGLFSIRRRTAPLVADRRGYQAFVRAVFSGRGRGLGAILPAVDGLTREASARWLRARSISPTALPRDLTADQWADLWRTRQAHQARGPAPTTGRARSSRLGRPASRRQP